MGNVNADWVDAKKFQIRKKQVQISEIKTFRPGMWKEIPTWHSNKKATSRENIIGKRRTMRKL